MSDLFLSTSIMVACSFVIYVSFRVGLLDLNCAAYMISKN